MGTVHQLPAATVSITPQEAARAYLAAISHAESAGTKRVYGAVLHRFAAQFADAAHVAAAQARILARDGKVPSRAPQTVRGTARAQGII